MDHFANLYIRIQPELTKTVQSWARHYFLTSRQWQRNNVKDLHEQEKIYKKDYGLSGSV